MRIHLRSPANNRAAKRLLVASTVVIVTAGAFYSLLRARHRLSLNKHLVEAVCRGDKSATASLLASGASASSIETIETDRTILETLFATFSRSSDGDDQDDCTSVLMLSIENRGQGRISEGAEDLESVNMVLKHGADVRIHAPDGTSALSVA